MQQSAVPDVRARGPSASRRGAVPSSEPSDPELVELFDRYLSVHADATRRFGHLFPYNHLRHRIQAILAGRTARVLVRDAAGAHLATFDIEWRDGELRRARFGSDPAFTWVLDVRTLEGAATTPWAYLAHPRRLGLAWFPTADVSQPNHHSRT